jgi:hypothetical protein
MSPSSDPTQRFKGRVENYDKYRPLYPRDVLELLEMDAGSPAPPSSRTWAPGRAS